MDSLYRQFRKSKNTTKVGFSVILNMLKPQQCLTDWRVWKV